MGNTGAPPAQTRVSDLSACFDTSQPAFGASKLQTPSIIQNMSRRQESRVGEASQPTGNQEVGHFDMGLIKNIIL